MKNAVEKRENFKKSARKIYFNKVIQAYDKRRNDLSQTWSIVNHKERQKAIRCPLG